MWKSLFGRKQDTIDTRDWHPRVNVALDLFKEKKWSDLSLLVSRQSPDSAFKLISALGARSPLEDKIGSFPQTPTMLMIMGGVQAVWAWRHRGYGVSDTVDETRWPRFYKSLENAQQDLQQLLEVRENSSVGLSFLGRVLTGLSDTDQLALVEARFNACSDRPVEGCAVFLQARSPKWHGDHDSMFAFAKRAASDGRLHPARHALLARAHVERWLYDAWMADEDSVNQAGRVYMSSATTVEDIHRLNARFNDDMVDDLNAQKNEAACRFAHDNLGFALYLSGQRQEAAKHIAALGAQPSDTPWSYALGEEIHAEWGRLRKSVGLSRRINIERQR